jgi:nitrite reductase/ring-hydroxylating ferredoxin subunit
MLAVSASRLVRLFPVSDLPPGGGMPVEVEDRLIAVFNVDGVFHAIDNECPHRGGSLADGALLGGRVVCPLHHWVFDLATGRNPVNPELGVRHYPTRVKDGAVWLELPTKPN